MESASSPTSILDALFPREEPWSDEQNSLFLTLLDCHRRAALDNNNLSSMAVKCSANGGAPFQTQVIAGLATVGVIHAPVTYARNILFGASYKRNWWMSILADGHPVPGFGNSFFKDRIDPAFQPAFDALSGEFREYLSETASNISSVKGCQLYPNAASITAAVAESLNLPLGAEVLIFVIGRSAGWLTL